MLARAADMGYDAAELTPHSLDAIWHGQLDRHQVARIRNLTSSFPLHYIVHAPNELNVAHHEDLSLQIQVFKACLDFCAEVESDMLVYHSGQIGLERAAWGLSPLPAPKELGGRWAAETANLTELADYAAHLGVTIAIENRLPNCRPFTAAYAWTCSVPRCKTSARRTWGSPWTSAMRIWPRPFGRRIFVPA
jgi:sugar phosphate isomerase/epimerase